MDNNQKRKRPTVAEKRLEEIFEIAEIILANSDYAQAITIRRYREYDYVLVDVWIATTKYILWIRPGYILNRTTDVNMDVLVDRGFQGQSRYKLKPNDIKEIHMEITNMMVRLANAIDRVQMDYARTVARNAIINKLKAGAKFDPKTGREITVETFPALA